MKKIVLAFVCLGILATGFAGYKYWSYKMDLEREFSANRASLAVKERNLEVVNAAHTYAAKMDGPVFYDDTTSPREAFYTDNAIYNEGMDQLFEMCEGNNIFGIHVVSWGLRNIYGDSWRDCVDNAKQPWMEDWMDDHS